MSDERFSARSPGGLIYCFGSRGEGLFIADSVAVAGRDPKLRPLTLRDVYHWSAKELRFLADWMESDRQPIDVEGWPALPWAPEEQAELREFIDMVEAIGGVDCLGDGPSAEIVPFHSEHP